MSVATVTAARILAGQLQDKTGEENVLSFERMPYTGFSKTYNVDAQTADSAGSITAMMTGVKTNSGLVAVDENALKGACSTMKDHKLVSILELAELAGKSTGIVSTTRVTHATPAATYAKSVDRYWEVDSLMPKDAIEAGCKDIAMQLIEFKQTLQASYPDAKNIDGLEVVLGGGSTYFLPANNGTGLRNDNQNLIALWQKNNARGIFVNTKNDLNAVNVNKYSALFGLFNETHMSYEIERTRVPSPEEPSLTEMTHKAISFLSKDDKAYFLMVEAGRIDHAHRMGNAKRALTETIEFSKAIKKALETVDLKETLVIVTADHGNVMTMAGHSKRGNPILGKVIEVDRIKPSLALDGKPYTTLSYANGMGFFDGGSSELTSLRMPSIGRADLTKVDTQALEFHQEALVPLALETHSGEDVGIYAQGPNAALVSGVNEQNLLFHIMQQALLP